MSLALTSRKAALLAPWLRNPLWAAARAVPSLDLRFADSKSLVDATTGQNLVTFTRASGGTYVDSQGVIRNAVTNLLLRSEELGTSPWFSANVTLTNNSTDVIDPFGATRSTKIVSVGAGAVGQGTTIATVSTGSVWLRTSSGTANISLIIYLSASPFTNIATVNITVTTAWQRFSVTSSSPATQASYNFQINGIPSTTLYAFGAQLEQSSTVGEYIPTGATINSAPRFDHNPTTGESLGLLVEQETQNLLLHSENLATTWSNSASSETTDAITAPNGTLTADKLEEDATTAAHYILQAFTPVNATTYTFSIFVKAAERGFALVGFNTGSLATTFVSINLSTGALTTAVGTPLSSTVQAFANNWYRVSLTLASTGTTTSSVDVRISTDGLWANRSYAGTIGNGIYIWGAQLEAGAFPTSYIPTTTATVTRSADVASISGSNFSSWYRQDESSVFLDCRLLTGSALLTSATRSVLDVSDGTGNNRLIVRAIVNNTLSDSVTVRSNGGTSFNVTTGATVDTAARKLSAAFKANDTALVSTGASNVATGDTGAMPIAASQLNIGGIVTLANANFLSGHISRLTYWPQRLGNEVLQRITQ